MVKRVMGMSSKTTPLNASIGYDVVVKYIPSLHTMVTFRNEKIISGIVSMPKHSTKTLKVKNHL